MMMSVMLSSQIMPPTIQCISSDTLFYTPVANSCGPFVSLDIFTSSNANGPFSFLDSVLDENADFYVDPNSSGQILFYFIIPNFNCPGETTINSDTISNRPPEVGILQTVSVEDGNVELSWLASPSAETINYTVFLNTDDGLEFVATTPNIFFTDTVNDPNSQSLTYIIVANDGCGIQSVFGDPVSSILLVNSFDICNNTADFEWNMHVNTSSQELWAEDENGVEIFIAEISSDEESFFLEEVPNIPLNGFFIRSVIDGNDNLIVNSNISSIGNEMRFALEEIFISEVRTNGDNTVEIQWCWDENASLSSYDITYNSPIENTSINNPSVTSLSPIMTESIALNNTITEAYTVNISTLDECNRVFESGEINGIQLEVAPIDEGLLRIDWTDYGYSEAALQGYVLHEIIDGDDRIIYEGFDTSFDFETIESTGMSCFFVEAFATGLLLDGSEKSTVVQSNIECSLGFPIVRLPNAFNPYGVNRIFIPLFGNTDAISTYEMTILSRYGQVLFSTNSLDQGWNGRNGLREMPQGVYSYLIDIEIQGGQTLMLQGSVLLLR